MKMCSRVLIAMFCLFAWTREAAPQHTYSKAVGVETEALIIDPCP